MAIRILIAEDDSLLRRTLVELIQLDVAFEVIAQVGNGQAALEQAGVLRPEVVLTDIDMPKMNGIEATRALKQLNPDCAVVILTKFGDDENLFNAIKAGASGYVLKDASIDEIKAAVVEAHQGDGHLNPSLVARVLAEFSRVAEAKESSRQTFAELSRREVEVLEMIGKGMRNKAIAEALFLSEKTVKTHVTAVFKKLHVNDRTEAAILAQKHGLSL